MARGVRSKVAFRRRREGRTNYYDRLKLISSKKARVLVRGSNKHMHIQLIESRIDGDITLIEVGSGHLNAYGYSASTSNTTAAYLTGLLFGSKCLEKKFEMGVLDIGLASAVSGSKAFAALKGIVDTGFNVPHSPGIFPDESRIRGEHIDESIPPMFLVAKNKIISEMEER